MNADSSIEYLLNFMDTWTCRNLHWWRPLPDHYRLLRCACPKGFRSLSPTPSLQPCIDLIPHPYPNIPVPDCRFMVWDRYQWLTHGQNMSWGDSSSCLIYVWHQLFIPALYPFTNGCRNKVNSILKTPLNIFHFSNERQQFSFGYLHDLFHNK